MGCHHPTTNQNNFPQSVAHHGVPTITGEYLRRVRPSHGVLCHPARQGEIRRDVARGWRSIDTAATTARGGARHRLKDASALQVPPDVPHTHQKHIKTFF